MSRVDLAALDSEPRAETAAAFEQLASGLGSFGT